jgi:hypothetical protein
MTIEKLLNRSCGWYRRPQNGFHFQRRNSDGSGTGCTCKLDQQDAFFARRSYPSEFLLMRNA